MKHGAEMTSRSDRQSHVPDQKQSNVRVVLSTSDCFLTSQLRATDGEERARAGGSGGPSLNLPSKNFERNSKERARKSSFLTYRAGLPRSGSPVRFWPIHPPRERTIAPNRGGVICSRCLEERGGRKEAGVEVEVEVEDNAEYDSRFWDSKHYAADLGRAEGPFCRSSVDHCCRRNAQRSCTIRARSRAFGSGPRSEIRSAIPSAAPRASVPSPNTIVVIYVILAFSHTLDPMALRPSPSSTSWVPYVTSTAHRGSHLTSDRPMCESYSAHRTVFLRSCERRRWRNEPRRLVAVIIVQTLLKKVFRIKIIEETRRNELERARSLAYRAGFSRLESPLRFRPIHPP
ncbi:LOW QUALITY PROTEIN: hypothetical protein CVT26_001359 [Gymnopilus dilepis]|uniref:Uncharacterized protein n=1 Tax=Gymnopilus dilepis TaxID=231916 RepID=A0A409YNE7_9AGAR|nr:LOW QUALITY PROTEIN: hypothetical protein CVT26_001359 [Gymnopilus dilepis]